MGKPSKNGKTMGKQSKNGKTMGFSMEKWRSEPLVNDQTYGKTPLEELNIIYSTYSTAIFHSHSKLLVYWKCCPLTGRDLFKGGIQLGKYV